VSDLKRRALTAFVAGPLILILFAWLPLIPFLGFMGIILAVSVYELLTMARAGHKSLTLVLVVSSLVPLYLSQHLLYALWSLCAPAVLLLFRLGPKVEDSSTNEELGKEIVILILSLTFLCIPLFSFYKLKELGSYYPVVLVMAIWGSDTTAYLLGKSLGRHKLAPAISPKKTTEGLLGALAGAAFVIVLLHGTLGLGLFAALLVGCIVGILGQLGDMLESVAKRVFSVKDSSALFPGHGGILDRIDSFLLTAPFLFYLLSRMQG
jgi:phosphatidate cytidylyltransferase